jgi:hypothetical protein
VSCPPPHHSLAFLVGALLPIVVPILCTISPLLGGRPVAGVGTSFCCPGIDSQSLCQGTGAGSLDGSL